MGRNKDFKIFFDNDKDTYFAGQQLAGTVLLEFSEPTNIVRLLLIVKGMWNNIFFLLNDALMIKSTKLNSLLCTDIQLEFSKTWQTFTYAKELNRRNIFSQVKQYARSAIHALNLSTKMMLHYTEHWLVQRPSTDNILRASRNTASISICHRNCRVRQVKVVEWSNTHWQVWLTFPLLFG